MVFKVEVYYKVDRLLTGLTAQQKGTTAQWYSNKTSLLFFSHTGLLIHYSSTYFILFKGSYLKSVYLDR